MVSSTGVVAVLVLVLPLLFVWMALMLVADLGGHIASDKVSTVVGEEEEDNMLSVLLLLLLLPFVSLCGNNN